VTGNYNHVYRPITAGKEPDHSFSFEIEKKIPDLAIEVVFSSGSVRDLSKYKYLGVSEVWFWQNEEIKFYQLVDSQYVEIEISSQYFSFKLCY
jgi:Uma2 family endonuclease